MTDRRYSFDYVPLMYCSSCFLKNFQEVESVFDVMELEDEERKDLLKMEDSQMVVRLSRHINIPCCSQMIGVLKLLS